MFTWLVSCDRHETYGYLTDTDSIIVNQENYYLALDRLNDIDISDLDSKSKAYFYLLKTKVLFRMEYTLPNEDMINYSIDYYKKHNNSYKLAESYYLKARNLENRGDMKNNIICLKQAEKYIEKCNDNVMKARIYMNLSTSTSYALDSKTSLVYAKKALEHARMADCDEEIAYSYINMSVAYGRMDMKDSAIWCMDQCKPLIAKADKKLKRGLLVNLAATYYFVDLDKCLEYAFESIKIEPTPNAYLILGQVYQSKGMPEKAESCMRKGISMCENNLSLKITIMYYLYELFHEIGNDSMAMPISDSLMVLRDSMEAKMEKDSIRVIQLLMTAENEKEIASNGLLLIINTCVAVLIILIVFGIIRKRKYNKKIENIHNDEYKMSEELDKLKKQINAQRRNEKNSNSETSEDLKEKIKIGHKIFERVCDNKPINTISNKEILCFVEYVKTARPDLIESIESIRDDAPYGMKLLNALLVLDKSDRDISIICAIGLKSVNIKKWRMKKYLR